MAISTAQETVEDDVTKERRRWRLGDPSPAARLEEATGELEQHRDRVQTLHQFFDMADADPLPAAGADVILSAVEAVTRQTKRQKISVPFIPKGDPMEAYSDWTAGKLRWLLTAMATAEGQELADLLAIARKKAIIEFGLSQCDVADLAAQAEQERVELAAQVEREHRERLLLPEDTMERVARYEAHLSRELYKAMHELEALQERRCGHLAPLTRCDITATFENPKLPNELPG
jgi:hypothetical protein